MPVYRLVPALPADDKRWAMAKYQGEIVVRAASTGEARAIASLEEANSSGSGFPRSTTQVVASAFRDELLYSVILDSSGRFAAEGPIQVLHGDFIRPSMVPFHKD